MSFLSYNGVQLQLVRTIRFDREAVYDDDRTTYLWTRFLIEVDCVYNPQATSFTGPNPVVAVAGSTATATDLAIRHALMTPRQKLIFTVGAYTLLTSPKAPYIVDAHNGPNPLSINIQQIHGSKTFMVRYAIETFLLECPIAEGPALVSHRWTETHDVNPDFFTLRRVRGRAKFRSDLLLNAGNVPDDFRASLFMPIPPHFKRQSIHVVALSDGTELDYEVIDQEVYQSLGANSPATRVEASFAVSTAKGGATYYASMQVRCFGRPTTSKSQLFFLAAQIAATRINFLDPNLYTEQAAFIENLMEPMIEFQTTVRIPASQTNTAKIVLPPIAFAANGVGTVFRANEILNPTPADGVSRGDWNGRAVANVLASPCFGVGGVLTSVTAEAGTVSSLQGGPIISVGITASLPPVTNQFSTANQSGFYTEYKINTEYRTLYNKMQVPVAEGTNGNGNTCQIIDIAAPTTQKIVTLTAERFQQYPQLPLLDTGDRNDVLLRDERIPATPELLGDGQSSIYRASIRYVYALKKNILQTTDLHTGAVPYAMATEPTNVLRAMTTFQDGIIGTGGGTTLRTP